MAAMYRIGSRVLLFCRQSCHAGHSYVELSQGNVRHLQLLVRRCLSDSLKHKGKLNFDFNQLDLDARVKVKDVEEKPAVVEDKIKIDKKMTEVVSEEKEEVQNEEKKESQNEDRHIGPGDDQTESSDKYSFKQTLSDINSLENRETVLENLSVILKKYKHTEKLSSALVSSLKRLETLNDTHLSEEVSLQVAMFLDENNNIGKIPNADFIQILAFFVKNNKEDSKVTFDLLHEACWRLRKVPLSLVIEIGSIIKTNCTTSKRKEVFEEAEQKVVDGIGAVSSPSMLLSVMYLLMSNTKYRQRIEEEIPLLLPSMDPIQTYKVLYLLARYKSKNMALIHKTKFHLLSRPISFDLKKLSNLFFACDSLRIYDQILLQELSTSVVDHLSTVSDISSFNVLPILNSCSKMGWNNTQLTDSIMNIIQNSTLNWTKTEEIISLAYLVVSLGHLNLLQYSEFSSKLAGNLQSLKVERPALWLDVVHALACTKTAEANDVRGLLSEDFYQPLLDSLKDKPAFLQNNMRKKLLSLYGYLKVDLSQSFSEVDAVAAEWRKLVQRKTGRNLVRMAKPVGEVLADFAPHDKYTNTNIVTQFGTNIEFELFVDDTPKAVRVDEAEGKQRIWIKVLEFNDFVRGSGEPVYTGNTAMTVRHLSDEKNVHVIYVSYAEWNKLDKKLGQLHFLESKIKAAVCPEKESQEEPAV